MDSLIFWIGAIGSLLGSLAVHYFFPSCPDSAPKYLRELLGRIKNLTTVLTAFLGLLLSVSLAWSETHLDRISQEQARSDDLLRAESLRVVREVGLHNESLDRFLEFSPLWKQVLVRDLLNKDTQGHDERNPFHIWHQKVLDQFVESYQRGEVNLPAEEARHAVMSVLEEGAIDQVVATNVGGLDFFFDDKPYISSNRDATQRGVQIVRLFLFRGGADVQLTASESVRDATEDKLLDAVRELQDRMPVLASYVVDLNKLGDSEAFARDLMIIDKECVIETRRLSNGAPTLGVASALPANVNSARATVHELAKSIGPDTPGIFLGDPKAYGEVERRLNRSTGARRVPMNHDVQPLPSDRTPEEVQRLSRSLALQILRSIRPRVLDRR